MPLVVLMLQVLHSLKPSITQSGSNVNTFTGASTFSNTITVGVDDTGHDVKFFGAIWCVYVMG